MSDLDLDLTDGYFPPNPNHLRFDPTGINPHNHIQNETVTITNDTSIFPTKGPFYVGETIVGIKKNTTVTVPLVPFVDYIYSPMFGVMKSLLGVDTYSYILLLDYTLWQTVSLSYHAVGGILDDVLLSQIAQLGAFDRTDLSRWGTLQGDSVIMRNITLADLVNQSANVYMLSKQLDAIASNLSGPSEWLEYITEQYQKEIGQIGQISQTLVSLITSLAQIGIIDGSLVTAPTTPVYIPQPGELRRFLTKDNTPPVGWEICGSAINLQSTIGKYANLFNTIGYSFGGTGTQFSLPWTSVPVDSYPNSLLCFKV